MNGSLRPAGFVPGAKEADVRCVNAHDLCWQGGPCPYCEIVCHRDSRGRFAKARTTSSVGMEPLQAAECTKENTKEMGHE